MINCLSKAGCTLVSLTDRPSGLDVFFVQIWDVLSQDHLMGIVSEGFSRQKEERAQTT